MNILLGILGLSINLLFVLILIKKTKGLAYILPIALLLRVILVIINNYFFTLPDGRVDAISFEEIGWLWYINDELFFEKFNPLSTFFYSWLIGFIYSIFDRSILILQSLSIFAGIGVVYLTWKFSLLLFNNKYIAQNASLQIAMNSNKDAHDKSCHIASPRQPYPSNAPQK